MTSATASKPPYEMKFDVGTIKHLGLQMYSTLPPVVGELVANAWDANATRVEITIPEGPLSKTATITITDNGIGMSDTDIRTKYIITGRDRRSDDRSDRTPPPLRRRVMGRKGIGKFSSFGIAEEIEIESIKNGEASRLVMNYHTMLDRASSRTIDFPALEATGDIQSGSRFTLRNFIKFKTKSVPIGALRRGLARRFSIIGASSNFDVIINGRPISPEERDLRRLLDKDDDGNPYIWNYDNEPVAEGANWTVSGWIGALKRTSPQSDNVDRGVALMARGKLVQEPFVFDAVVGQQYALSYIIGELHVEFVDEEEDTIGTNRNALVWDTEANTALKAWGRSQVNKIAREWAERRSDDNQKALEKSEIYREFKRKADRAGQAARAEVGRSAGTPIHTKQPYGFTKRASPDHTDVIGLPGVRRFCRTCFGTSRRRRERRRRDTGVVPGMANRGSDGDDQGSQRKNSHYRKAPEFDRSRCVGGSDPTWFFERIPLGDRSPLDHGRR